MLVDTHCHLNLEDFDEDRKEVLENARDHGVNRILIPAINLDSVEKLNEIADVYPETYLAIGIHPNDANSWNAESYQTLKILAGNPKVVAIGEIGLDYYWDRTPYETQVNVLKKQLEISEEMDLPVVIHTRDRDEVKGAAIEDVYWILKDWVSNLVQKNMRISLSPGVLHSFSYDITWARKFIELNFMIGITGPVTFKKAEKLREVVELLDLEKILIETDSPFLTPHPFRGMRNQPANVRFIVEKISEIKNISFNEVALITSSNARRLFSW